MRPLTEDQRRVFTALSDEFMSASVIKIRAGYSSAVLTKEIIGACVELERRGLAQHYGFRVRSKSRWRRQPGAEDRADAYGLR